jgi:hypothetical protein
MLYLVQLKASKRNRQLVYKVHCVRKVAMHLGYGSGLYRRSWTSLPTLFISAQRLTELNVVKHALST